MKILTLVWSIGIGGTERAAVNYAIGYKKFAHDSRVLVLGDGHERYPDLQEAGVSTTLVTVSPTPVQEILRELKLWSPDIIHVHNYTVALLKYLNSIKGKQTKIVETNVFSRPNFSPDYRVVNLSMQLSGWGCWKYTRGMKNAGYCPQVSLAPYIVDVHNFIEPSAMQVKSFLSLHNIPASAFVIGRLGQAHPSKWDVRIVEVIRKTIHPDNNIYYLFVGLPGNLAELISKQPRFFRSRVVSIDKIEGDKNLSLYYHSLNCFAHISKIGESFGYVLAEALVCKVPVITMLTPLKDNAQYEVVGLGNGRFCVTNTHQFIEAVNKLHANQAQSSFLKNNLNSRIEGRFSYNVIIPRQIELFTTLLANKRLPVTDVSGVIRGCVKCYKGWEKLIAVLIRCVNSPVFYNIVSGVKSQGAWLGKYI